MKWVFAFFIFVQGAFAAEVNVRSGQHDDFTRFTFSIAEGGKWEMRERDGRVFLWIEGADYNLSNAFMRIGRKNVLALTPMEEGEIEFNLNCACSFRPFLAEKKLLAIDFFEGDPLTREEPIEVNIYSPSSSPNIQILDEAEFRDMLLDQLLTAQRSGIHAPNVNLPFDTLPPVGMPHISAHDSADLAFRRIPAPTVSKNGAICQNPNIVTWSPWRDEKEAYDLISTGYADLYTSGEVLDPRALDVLVRRLLSAGLSLEAKAVLSLAPLNEDRAFLLEIAHLIAQENSSTLLKDQAGCGGAWELWSLLAGAQPSDETISEAVNALMLTSLPLRRQLAGDVGKKVFEAGRYNEARALAILGAGEASSRNLNVLLDLTSLGAFRAVDSIARMFSEGIEVEAETLLYLARYLREGESDIPNPFWEQLAAVRAQNLREGGDGTLLFAEIELLLVTKQFGAAQSLLTDLRAHLTEGQYAQLYDDFVLGQADQEDELIFLSYVLTLNPRHNSPRVSHQIARRLIDLGFYDVAQDFLSNEVKGDDLLEQRRLRAEAHFYLEQFEEAEAILRTLPEEVAENVRESLRVKEGDDEDFYWWRQAAWGRLLNAQNPTLAQASALALRNTQPLQKITSLAQAEALLEEVKSLRALEADLQTIFPPLR